LRAGLIAAAVTTAAFVAGCGGGGDDNTAQQGADAVARCQSELAPKFPAGPVRESADRICLKAAELGYLDDGEITEDEILPILRADPTLLEPVCLQAATQGFDLLPPSARRYIDVTPEAWGEMFCEAAVAGDHFNTDGSITPASAERLYRDHPELAAPFLFAGLMESYDSSSDVSKATWEQIARKAAHEALRRGIVTAQSTSDFDADEAAFRALIREISADVQGD
jgi:hypothetical protein